MQLVCCGKRICQLCTNSRLKQLTQCPFCSEPGTPEVIHDRGYQRDLDRLQIKCPRCNDKLPRFFKDLPRHLDSHRDLPCKHCGEKFIFPQQLKKHQQNDCGNRTVHCPLSFVGCSTEVPYKKLNEHYLSSDHQQCLMKSVKQISPRHPHEQAKLSDRRLYDERYLRGLKECLQKIEVLMQDVVSSLGNCNRLKSEQDLMETRINEAREQCAKLQDSSNNCTKLLESLSQILAAMERIIGELKSKSMTGPNLILPDGTYIFKFNFTALLNDGQAIRSESIFSSQSGYKLALIYEIFEERQKQKRYLSISIVLLMGNFDPILFWPMVYPITLRVMDLTPAKEHISHLISAENRTTAFNRPVNDANIPFRISQFCLVDKLVQSGNKYLEDGSAFVQLAMDFTAPNTNRIPGEGSLKHMEDAIQRNIVENMS